jgi:small subunit ribosomal protein S6
MRTMRTYELMTIHRPELAEDDVRKEAKGLEKFLKGAGASVSETDFWGKRRLAYEIDNVHEGYYTVMTFEGEPEHVADLNRALLLADTVLRHKVVRPDLKPSKAGARPPRKGDDSDR